MNAYQRLSDIPDDQYDVLCADPPWLFKLRSKKGEAKSAQAQYSCMTIEDIKSLDVGRIAKRDSFLFLWATSPLLHHQFEVAKAWGFEPKTMLYWGKRSETWFKGKPDPKWRWGTGYRARGCVEPVILATRGKPKGRGQSTLNIFEAAAREHSRKPDEFFEIVRRYKPDAQRIELFSRESREGFDTFGDEVGKFDAA